MCTLAWMVAILANVILAFAVVRAIVANKKLNREREAQEMKRALEERRDWIRFDQETW